MGDAVLRGRHEAGCIWPRIDYNARLKLLPVLEELRSAIQRCRHSLAMLIRLPTDRGFGTVCFRAHDVLYPDNSPGKLELMQFIIVFGRVNACPAEKILHDPCSHPPHANERKMCQKL